MTPLQRRQATARAKHQAALDELGGHAGGAAVRWTATRICAECAEAAASKPAPRHPEAARHGLVTAADWR